MPDPQTTPLIALHDRGLRNAVKSIIYENFDDEDVVIERVIAAVRNFYGEYPKKSSSVDI